MESKYEKFEIDDTHSQQSIRPQVERYGPYTDRIGSVYGTVTVPNYYARDYGVVRTVLPRYTAPYTMPYYCPQDYGVVRLIYGRKIAGFSSLSDRKRLVNDAVLIDLGRLEKYLRKFRANSK